MTTGLAVLQLAVLDAAGVADVLALADAAGEADGAYPLSEHVVLHIRHGGEMAAVHLLVRRPDGALAGYAHVDVTDPLAGPSAEVVVHPEQRRRGLGRALVEAALTTTGSDDRPLRVWAHGDHPAAAALARRLGFLRVRVLRQLRRSLSAPLPEATVPAEVALRAFRPGVDDEAWVRLNARAFADHPEQGRWTVADLRIRMAEPWFDPAGFLLAVDVTSGELLGFHWTKVHRDGGGHRHDPIGEVYVLGVDPSVHTRGLGGALTVAGLRHLRGLGISQAMLYVDESNTAAMALYRRLGFTLWSTDVGYRSASLPDPAPAG